METKRSILERVRDGSLSPEEAAERLENLSEEPPAAAQPPASPAGRALRIRVIGDARTAKITGDPSIAEAVAEGPHTARREGDTLVIDASLDHELDEGFKFWRGDRPDRPGHPRVIIGVGSRPKPVSVHMNPDLPLEVELASGKVHVVGVHSPISGKVDAGAIRIEDVAGPFTLSVNAGAVNIEGTLRTGQSSIRCDAGSVKVLLRKGSSVKVRAHNDIGSIKLGARGIRGFQIGDDSTREVTFGDGEATLEITGSLGRIQVDEA